MSTQFVLSLFGSLISVLLAIAGGIGAWAALRVGRNAQIINNFRTSAESWEKVARAQEEELREVKSENIELKQALAEVRGQVAVLTSLVRSSIASMVSTTPKEVVDKIGELIAAIEEKK